MSQNSFSILSASAKQHLGIFQNLYLVFSASAKYHLCICVNRSQFFVLPQNTILQFQKTWNISSLWLTKTASCNFQKSKFYFYNFLKHHHASSTNPYSVVSASAKRYIWIFTFLDNTFCASKKHHFAIFGNSESVFLLRQNTILKFLQIRTKLFMLTKKAIL